MSKKLNRTPTILVAEADEDSRFLMRSLLEMGGYRVVQPSTLTLPRTAEIEAVSDSPDWIELRVSGEMKAVLTAEKMLALFAAGIPSETRETV